MLNLRSALFSEITNSKQYYNNTDTFLLEKETYISSYKDTLTKLTSSSKIKNSINSIDKAKRIAMSYSINSSKKFEHKNLISKISKLREGYGVCSDHSEVFLALSHIYGLTSREVHNTEHTFNEFYAEELKKWIWIDSQFALMAFQNGNPLNLMEMKILYDKEIIPEFYFFGNSNFTASNGKPQTIKYYDNKNDFETIMMTKGNNVFEVDSYSNILASLPKGIKQIFLLLSNKQPDYLIYYSYGNDRINELIKLKNYFYGYIIVWLIGNLSIVILKLNKRNLI